MNTSALSRCGLVVAALSVFAFPCYGTVITFASSYEFSGGTAPAGLAPWVTTRFDDGDTPGSVVMTITATNLVNMEFVSVATANLDPLLDVSQLLFSAPTKTGSFTDPVVTTGVDFYKANGDGYFDIKVAFATSDGSSSRFGPGDAVSYTITGIPTLTASSFDFLSAPGGGHGLYPVAQHIQGIGECGAYSGWVTVPEPATLAMLATGGLAMIVRKRR